MIDINNITVRIGTKILIQNSSAHISDGQKVGVIGPNGSGKSTLFKVIKNEMETEAGSVYIPPASRISFVEQEFDNFETSLMDFVLNKDIERKELLQKLKTASEFELAEIHERLNAIEAASAEARAASILNGLGFGNSDLNKPIKEFSGGWQMRMALAAALFQPSEILLLDEPTNHLDLEASIWLESHLQKYRGTLLLISHDKHILNSICNYILHLDNTRLVSYTGNYDIFKRTRDMQKVLLEKQAIKQEKKRQHLQSFVDRFRYKATKAKQAQSRIKMLEKMEDIALIEDNPAIRFDFPEPLELAPPLVTIENGAVGYGEKIVLRNLNFSIAEDDRIALLGANGNGKSTLAKLISHRLKLMEGKIHRNNKLEVGYFAQHQAEELPLDQTPTEFMARLMNERLEVKVRTHLARFGLEKDKALTTIKNLSGGEKAKLLFAAMSYNSPALLILDEPNNHLDMDARDALITALNEYKGAIILITHDLYLIELIADNLWLVKDSKCKPYDGDLDDYRNMLLSTDSDKKQTAKKEKTEKKKVDFQEIKLINSQIKRLERELEKLNIKKAEVENKFAEVKDTNEIVSLQKDLAQILNHIDETEQAWFDLNEKL
ncbi:MAG: ATP-binding cassette domain-containing protein [Lactobacillaceae bacterium]|jgi:ATP-binding cassette subfamily F protein 3|nr:ATP-binding cassette domain-containing protein [Lactobacillaceae bacterium]